MSKEFVVGKQYKLVDASKDAVTKEVINNGQLALPAVFTCHSIDADGDCTSHTDGVLWEGDSAQMSLCHDGWLCATKEALIAGAFEEVNDE